MRGSALILKLDIVRLSLVPMAIIEVYFVEVALLSFMCNRKSYKFLTTVYIRGRGK